MHEGLGDEWHEGQLDSVAGLPLLADFFAQLHHPRHVHLENRVHVGAGAARLYHALGNLPAHGRHGHEFARNLLEGRRSGSRCRTLLRLGLRLLLRLRHGLGLRLWHLTRRCSRTSLHTGAMLLNKALDVVLSDPPAQARSRHVVQVYVVFARNAAHQR